MFNVLLQGSVYLVYDETRKYMRELTFVKNNGRVQLDEDVQR